MDLSCLGGTYLKSWMTEFFEDFFFSTVGGWIKKKHPHPHQGTEVVKKKIYYSLTETPPLLLLIGYESFNTISLGWSICCCGIVHVPGTWKGLLYSG